MSARLSRKTVGPGRDTHSKFCTISNWYVEYADRVHKCLGFRPIKRRR